MSNSDPERDQARLDLIRSLEPALGPDATDTLMRHLPPVTWDDLVTRADLALTEERLRNEMSVLGKDLTIEMERGFRRQIMWLGTLGTAWFGVAVTVLQLMR